MLAQRTQRKAQRRPMSSMSAQARSAQNGDSGLASLIRPRGLGLIQGKLRLGAVGDRYEREADAVAERVTADRGLAPSPPPAISHLPPGGLGAVPQPTQRMDTEEETAQARALPRTDSDSPSPHHALRAISGRSGGEPLPSRTRRTLEKGLGADLGGVRVHRDGEAQAAATALRARAFTNRSHIWLGRGESPDDHGLMAHEATHVVQQGGAVQAGLTGGGPAIQRAAIEPEREEETVQAGFWDSVSSAAGAVWDATGGQLVDAAGELIEMGTDFFWTALEAVAPSFVPLLREISSKGILGFLKEKIVAAFDFIFSGLADQSPFLALLLETFQSLAVRAREILVGLAAGNCEPLFAAVSELKAIAGELAGRAWQAVTDFFRPIGDFFAGLWQSFGAPVVTWLGDTAGAIWEGIQAIGNDIWAWTQPFRDSLAAGWNWVKGLIGLGGDEGESAGGIGQWIAAKAEEVWGGIKAELQPVIEPVQMLVADVRAILPLDAITDLRGTIEGWLEGMGSMAETMAAEDEGVVANQDILREQILPAVLNTIAAFRGRLVTTGTWLAGVIGSVTTTVTGFVGGLVANPYLAPVSGALTWILNGANRLSEWYQSVVVGLFTVLGDALVYLSRFIEPILNALRKLFDVLGDLLGKLPDLLMGPVWWLLPDCIKNPIKDFILNSILKKIPIFGQILEQAPDIWARIKTTALTILKQIFVDGDLARAAWTYFSALLEIFGLPPELVTGILAKAASVFLDILRNPIGFMMNLLGALKQGFVGFFDNIGSHLIGGLIDWLFGALAEAGIQKPADFSLKSILGLVLDILGLTLDKILAKLEDRIGPKAMERLRKGWELLSGALEWIKVLMSEGISGLWRFVKEKLADLWSLVLSSISGWIMSRIIANVTAKLLSMLDPSGIMAVVQSLIAIYNAIQSFFAYLREMLEIVMTVLDGMGEIAMGAIGKAAVFVENALAQGIPIVIGFLANQVGLGGLGKRIREMVQKVQEKVDGAVDWLIDKVVNLGEAIIDKGKAGVSAITQWWRTRKEVKVDGKTYAAAITGGEADAELAIESSPKIPYTKWLANIEGQMNSEEQKAAHAKALSLGASIKERIRKRSMEKSDADSLVTDINTMAGYIKIIAQGLTGTTPPSELDYGSLTQGQGGKRATARILSQDGGGSVGTVPRDNPPIWLAVKSRKSDEQKRAYVQGHLLNHNVHGPGKRFNMTPITYKANAEHKVGIEKEIKERVLDKGQVVYYQVTAVYGTHTKSPAYQALVALAEAGQASEKDARKLTMMEADRKLCTRFELKAHRLEEENGSWVKASTDQIKKYPNVENKIPTKEPII